MRTFSRFYPYDFPLRDCWAPTFCGIWVLIISHREWVVEQEYEQGKTPYEVIQLSGENAEFGSQSGRRIRSGWTLVRCGVPLGIARCIPTIRCMRW
jgi:hypothetical protein